MMDAARIEHLTAVRSYLAGCAEQDIIVVKQANGLWGATIGTDLRLRPTFLGTSRREVVRKAKDALKR